MRDKKNAMPEDLDPNEIDSLRIWHCSYKTLKPVSELRRLHTLVIATYPDSSFELLSSLSSLRRLRVLHLPHITDLDPLAGLKELETLCLETSPGWDSSGKVTTVASLDPLSKLPSLKHISLFGVVSTDRSLCALERCVGLSSAKFSKYPKKEVERFFRVMKISESHTAEFENL